jgi:MarR family transcriptional regulator, organic hydroperoxide resistance regulator
VSTGVRGPGEARPPEGGRELNRELLDTFGALVKQFAATGQSIAASFRVAPSDLLALVKLDGVLTMKELAQRMGCDASFVTAVADALERHGLAKREPGQRDRRVKNLVLTPEGVAAKERLMQELAERMPWCYALNDTERQCLLGLLKKMLSSPSPSADSAQQTASDIADATVRSE